MDNSNAENMLPMPVVEQKTNYDRSSIYRMVKRGTFPPPVRCGVRKVAWRERDIVKWQQGLSIGVKAQG